MKKAIGAVLLAAMGLAGCAEETPEQQSAREALARQHAAEQAIVLQEAERAAEQQRIAEARVCRVGVDLRQDRFSLDIFAHMKDSMNAEQFTLPVACADRDQLKTGDNLVDQFRAGSFFLEGSISSWKMTVNDLPYVSPDADQTSCKVKLELRQSRFSLDLGQHLKDAFNATEFEWNVPGEVYEGMTEGQNLVKEGFRVGSLLFRGSVGSWNVTVKDKLGCAP